MSDHVPMTPADVTMTPAKDDGASKKRKWVEFMADELGMAPPKAKKLRIGVANRSEMEAVLGDHFDMIDQPDDPLPAQPRSTNFVPPVVPAAAPPTTQAELLAAMKFTMPDSGMDVDDTDTVAPPNPFSVDPDIARAAADKARDAMRRAPVPNDSPFVSPTLGNTRRDKIRPPTRQRPATGFGLLADASLTKKTQAKPVQERQANPLPEQVFTPQTDAIRDAWSKHSAEDQEMEDFSFHKFNDPGQDKSVPWQDLGDKRLRTGLQGPHTVANIALNRAMDQRMAAASSQTAKNRHLLQYLNELIAVGHIAPPGEVAEIMIGEEPDLYEKGASASKFVFAKNANPDRAMRVARYMQSYQEIYNQVSAAEVALSDSNSGIDPHKEKQILDEAFGRVDELLNMHPFQTYGWRGGDALVQHEEISGKKEASSANRLYGKDKAEKTDGENADWRVTGLSRLIDGVNLSRMFKNVEAYKAFLLSRLDMLLGGEGPAFPARALRNYGLEELFNWMLEKCAAYENEEEKKMNTTST